MELRLILGIVALAACDGTNTSPFLAPPVEAIDVVIHSSYAFAYVQAENNPDAVPLPELGECRRAREYEPMLWSCLETMRLGSYEMLVGDPPFFGDRTSAGVTTLRLGGCGVDIVFPIRAAPYVTATDVVVSRDDNGVLLSWNTSAPESLITGSDGFDTWLCHAARSPVRINGPDYRHLGYAVVPLELELHETALGPVRLWYGERAIPMDQ